MRRERDEFGLAGLFGLRFSLPAILVFVWILFRPRLLSVWIAGLGTIRYWEFVVASGGEELGGRSVFCQIRRFIDFVDWTWIGGFRLKCLRVWYHQNQIVSSEPAHQVDSRSWVHSYFNG